MRNKAFYKSLKSNGETQYDDAMSFLYDEITFQNYISKNKFTKICKKIEMYLETTSQFPNLRMLKIIKKAKNQNSKVYIVSDFYMRKDVLLYYLKSQNIDTSLFDDIFVSSDCHCRKQDGKLYFYIMQKLKLSPSEIIMYGDNKNSDYIQARKNGIVAKRKAHFIRKLSNEIKYKLRVDYGRRVFKYTRHDCVKYRIPFSEYSLVFSFFNSKLFDIHEKNILFLSREGNWFKKIYDEFQYLSLNESKQSNTQYFLCSRRAITSINYDEILKIIGIKDISVEDVFKAVGMSDTEINDLCGILQIDKCSKFALIKDDECFSILKSRVETNNRNFHKYCERFNFNSMLVDVGWKGTMQSLIERELKLKLHGYYLGVFGKISDDKSFKEGLLFDESQNNRYFHFIRGNTLLYEEFSAAPHGSAQTYVEDGDGISVFERWEDNEKKLYINTIEPWQNIVFNYVIGANLWSNGRNVSYRKIAKLLTRSGLFANKERLKFLKKIDEGYTWNFGKEIKGTEYNVKNYIHIDFFIRPEKYYRFFCKLQRKMSNSIFKMIIYSFISSVYYLYSWLLYDIKTIIFRNGK